MLNEAIVSPRQDGKKCKRLCVGLPGGYSQPDEVYNHAGTKPQTGLQLGPLGEQVGKTKKRETVVARCRWAAPE